MCEPTRHWALLRASEPECMRIRIGIPRAYAGAVACKSTPTHGIIAAATTAARAKRSTPPPHLAEADLAEAESEHVGTNWDDDYEASAQGDITFDAGDDDNGDCGDGDGGTCALTTFSVYNRMAPGATSFELFRCQLALGAIASGAGSDGGRMRGILLSDKMTECSAEVLPRPPQPLVTGWHGSKAKQIHRYIAHFPFLQAQRHCRKRGASLPDTEPYLEALRHGGNDSQPSCHNRAQRLMRLVSAAGRAHAQLEAWGWPPGICYVGTPGSLCLRRSATGHVEECKVEFVAVAVACKVACVGQLDEITMHADNWRENLKWLMAGGNEGATCLAVRVQVLSSLVKAAWEAADEAAVVCYLFLYAVSLTWYYSLWAKEPSMRAQQLPGAHSFDWFNQFCGRRLNLPLSTTAMMDTCTFGTFVRTSGQDELYAGSRVSKCQD